ADTAPTRTAHSVLSLRTQLQARNAPCYQRNSHIYELSLPNAPHSRRTATSNPCVDGIALSFWATPKFAILDESRGNPSNHRIRRNVLRNDRIRRNHSTISDRNAGENNCTGSHPYVIANTHRTVHIPLIADKFVAVVSVHPRNNNTI